MLSALLARGVAASEVSDKSPGQDQSNVAEAARIDRAPKLQSFAAYWFYLRFGVAPAKLGLIFFWAHVLAGISALLASRLATRIGLVRTMVVTHLPSSVLLILVPLMPNLTLAVLVLLVRFSISQRDVPTRQSYTMAVVRPEERSAAGGITGVARTAGASSSPIFAGFLFSRTALIDVLFFIAGTLKSAYDFVLTESSRLSDHRKRLINVW